MLKHIRDTTHYSGRDYDQVCSALNRSIVARERLKATLVARLTEALRGQDESIVKDVFLTVDKVFS